MSTPGPTPSSALPGSSYPSGAPHKASEIKLISHSSLFYWWPVWVLAFFMAAWTFFENNRLAILPVPETVVAKEGNTFEVKFKDGGDNSVLADAAKQKESNAGNPIFPTRVSKHPSLGVVFLITLVVTIIVTNVPLRGLWSFVVLMGIALISVIITLIPQAWDRIFEAVAGLRIHINLAGYLFIGIAVLILWAVATFVFDRRAYVLFTPGQIKVCEHIGAAVETFPTMGVMMTKQRDDLFRHYIFGFGSGDLILKFQTGDRREIRIPNVLGIGWQLKAVEDMLRTLPSASN